MEIDFLSYREKFKEQFPVAIVRTSIESLLINNMHNELKSS